MSQALIALINLSAVYAFPRGAWERVRKFPSAEGCQAKPDGVVDENLLCIPTRSMGTSKTHHLSFFWFPRSRVGTSCVHSRMTTHHLSFSV